MSGIRYLYRTPRRHFVDRRKFAHRCVDSDECDVSHRETHFINQNLIAVPQAGQRQPSGYGHVTPLLNLQVHSTSGTGVAPP